MAIDKSTEWRLSRLRIWNIAVGLVLAVQAERATRNSTRALPLVQYFNRLGCFYVLSNLCRCPVDNRITFRFPVV